MRQPARAVEYSAVLYVICILYSVSSALFCIHISFVHPRARPAASGCSVARCLHGGTARRIRVARGRHSQLFCNAWAAVQCESWGAAHTEKTPGAPWVPAGTTSGPLLAGTAGQLFCKRAYRENT